MLSQMSGNLRITACLWRGPFDRQHCGVQLQTFLDSISALCFREVLAVCLLSNSRQASRNRRKLLAPIQGCLNRYLEKNRDGTLGGRWADMQASWVFCLENMSDVWKQIGKGVKNLVPLLISVVRSTLLAEQDSLTGLCYWSRCWHVCHQS